MSLRALIPQYPRRIQADTGRAGGTPPPPGGADKLIVWP